MVSRDVFRNSPYQFIIGCQENRTGLLRTGKVDSVHSYDSRFFYFICPQQQTCINPYYFPGTAGQLYNVGFFHQITDGTDLIDDCRAGYQLPVKSTSSDNRKDCFRFEPYPRDIVIIEWPAEAADIEVDFHENARSFLCRNAGQ